MTDNVLQAGARPAFTTNRFVEVRFIFSQYIVFAKKKSGWRLLAVSVSLI